LIFSARNLGIEETAENSDRSKGYDLFLKIPKSQENLKIQDIVFFPF
jgi:hypothetical protein